MNMWKHNNIQIIIEKYFKILNQKIHGILCAIKSQQ